MKRLFKVIILFISAMSSFAANAQVPAARLDSFFNSLVKYKQLNGTVLVAENGRVILDKSSGFANFKDSVLNTDKTEFTLASVSKVFTSAAILQLRDRGKLKLSDAVVKYIPDFPYADITIRNLLSHTSGLPDYQLYEDQMNKNPTKIFDNSDILPSLKQWKKPLAFKPGERWQYSNTNFCLLALLVQKVSGMPFQQYIRKYIFIRAKMNGSYFAADPAFIHDRNRAINYEYPFLYSDKMQNVDSLKKYHWRTYGASGFVGQGNIITTSIDLLKFDQALYTGKLLNPSTLKEAFTPTRLNNGEFANADIGIGKASYGLGWFIMADTTAGKIVWHTGGQPGALSIFIRNITKKQTVIMFDNTFNKSLYGNGVNIMAILNDNPTVIRKESVTREYGQALVHQGVDVGFCKFQSLKGDSAHYYLSENDMNELGLQLLYAASFDNHNQLSLEVLKLNTLLFPSSFNTYDSYGEALAKNGKKQEAVFMYKKSLELNPKNEGGEQALKQLTSNKRIE